jgi:hypothetical protein
MQDDQIAREMIATETTTLTEAQSLYYSDLSRQRGRRGLLMELLSDGKFHPNFECATVGGVSYQCSLYTFRQKGWVIESRKDKGGVWSYRLAGKDEQIRERKLNAPQREVAKAYVGAVVKTMGQAASEKMIAALPVWLRVGR